MRKKENPKKQKKHKTLKETEKTQNPQRKRTTTFFFMFRKKGIKESKEYSYKWIRKDFLFIVNQIVSIVYK
jgi:hypothetical protein